MPENKPILLRLPPDLLAWVEKEALRKKRSRQAVIYNVILEKMINKKTHHGG